MKKLQEFIRSPRRSLITISLPVVASSLVETLYNITDTIFVGRLGSDALAAITYAWPLFFILVALSLGINAGIGSRISRFIGEKKKRQAENAALHGMLLSFLASIVVAIIGIPLLTPFFTLSGASGNVLQMAHTYMLIILFGIIFMFLSYTATSIFSAQGDTKTAMKIDIYSLVLNIILTPIFLFVFHMGIGGAALGTSLSVLFAFLQSLYFLKKRSFLRLNVRSFKYTWSIVKDIVKVGFPATLMMLVVSFYVVFLNRAMSHFSVSHVAAFGVVSRLESVAILPVYGLSVGAMTLVGMFYGAKKFDLLKSLSWYAIWISVLVTSGIGVLFFSFASQFLTVFTSDQAVITVGAPYMRLDVFTFPTMAIMMMVSRMLQGMGHGVPGFVMSIVRVFAIAIPLAYIFVFVLGYGYLSIAAAMIIGGIVTALIGLMWMRAILSKCKDKC